MSRANLNAIPRRVMALRNCNSLTVGATNLSSLSFTIKDPPSNASSLVFVPPAPPVFARYMLMVPSSAGYLFRKSGKSSPAAHVMAHCHHKLTAQQAPYVWKPYAFLSLLHLSSLVPRPPSDPLSAVNLQPKGSGPQRPIFVQHCFLKSQADDPVHSTGKHPNGLTTQCGIFFFLSAPVAFRRVALETPEWTSRDSNHHRQSVSAGKTNAIPTEPSGRLQRSVE